MIRGFVIRCAALSAVAALAAGMSACETTQDRAKALQEEGEALVANEVGVTVSKENPDVKVLSTTVLNDEFGAAVAVELQNTSNEAQVDLPIQVDVLNAQGKSVFNTNTPGLDPSLTQVPLLKPGETTYWVNDQLLVTGDPKSAKVKVGIPEGPAPVEIPELRVSEPRINEDTSGTEAEGTVENTSPVDQFQLVVYAVATRGGEVVAAGRGQFKNLAAGGKPLTYNVFFIGDPTGAEVQVVAPPSELE